MLLAHGVSRDSGVMEKPQMVSNSNRRHTRRSLERRAPGANQDYILGARWISRGFLELRMKEALPDKSALVVLYCAGGTRSALAAHALKTLGYTNVVSMQGGFGAWKRWWTSRICSGR